MDVVRIRRHVESCARRRLYASAIFYAEKLATVTGSADDVFLLAEMYFAARQYRRAIGLLKKHGLIQRSRRCRLLAAQSLAELRQWDECLLVLGDDESSDAPRKDNIDDESDQMAVVYFLRGKVYSAMENSSRAILWLEKALKADPYCVEALDLLVYNHMLSVQEEVALLNDLQFHEDDWWLRSLYAGKLKKYEPALKAFDEGTLMVDQVMPEFSGSLDVMLNQADLHYSRNCYTRCLDLTSRMLEANPYDISGLAPGAYLVALHVACLVELKMKNELFALAHRLVEENPDAAISWYAVACYYFTIEKFELARRFFSKATTTDSKLAFAWIGFGNAFAAQDESDQAMAAYRTASRLFVGCHLPLVYIGMEYMRTNNVSIAEQFFSQAIDICPTDPLVSNELGVVAFQKKQYHISIAHFEQALQLYQDASSNSSNAHEITLMNIGHAYRKLRDYGMACAAYEKALVLNPKSASTYAALGFTKHLQGKIHEAADMYHKSLALHPEDSFVTDMLRRTLESDDSHIESITQ